VQSVNGTDIVLLQDAGIKDFLRACARFLFGLENKDDVAVGRHTFFGYKAGQLEQDGGVAIMAASVSDGKGIYVAPDGNGG
jgi:hypothetical protein